MSGTTDEYYYVVDSGGTELAHAKMGTPLAFFPGRYDVKLNSTTQPAEVPSGGAVELKSGTLHVRGSTDEYYYVLSGTGTELAHNKLGRPLSFVEGSYTVKVNNTTVAAKVEAGQSNEYATGTLTVKGTGSDYYYVVDGASGTELAHAKVGQPVALAAGKYSVRLGKDTRPATVTAGQAAVVNW